MKVNIQNISKNSKIRSYLNPGLAAEVTHGKLTFSGWAHSDLGDLCDVVIKSNNTIFKTSLSIVRPDVEDHLKRNSATNITQPLGYKFDFLFSDGMEIGFELNGRCEWVYRIQANKLIEFDEFDTISALLCAKEGVCQNIYFHNADDWSKVIVMFNGALTEGKIIAEKAIFQRWSWAKHFKHPVVVVADPLTIGESPIALGWYMGDGDRNALPSIVEPLLAATKSRSPHSKILAFGSSGGGFAAIGGTLLGLFDEAIAINPQVDILKFKRQEAVDMFLEKRKNEPCDSDLKEYDFSRMKKDGSILYIQNIFDHEHFDIHYRPFREVCITSEASDKISFIEYSDEKAGHMPPSLRDLTKIIGDPFSELLAPVDR